MSAANILTMIRIVLIPVFIFFMLSEIPGGQFIAFGIFAIASITDKIDGYVARRFNQVTDFGKFIDPLADKLLVMAAMLLLVEKGDMPSVAAIIIIAREFAVTGLRLVGVNSNIVISAGTSGKIKTAMQMVGISVLMLAPYIIEYVFPSLDAAVLNHSVSWTLAAVTVWSGVDYVYKYRELFKKAK